MPTFISPYDHALVPILRLGPDLSLQSFLHAIVPGHELTICGNLKTNCQLTVIVVNQDQNSFAVDPI